jgi:hypothetical protein
VKTSNLTWKSYFPEPQGNEILSHLNGILSPYFLLFCQHLYCFFNAILRGVTVRMSCGVEDDVWSCKLYRMKNREVGAEYIRTRRTGWVFP